MSVLPESSEIGIMVSAKDITEAFSLEYTFEPENKAFEISMMTSMGKLYSCITPLHFIVVKMFMNAILTFMLEMGSL